MRHALLKSVLYASSLCGTVAASAEELVVQVADPGFTARIPGMPQVQMGPHPAAAQNPAARGIGASADGFNASVLTQKAEGASPQQCASWIAGSVISRNGADLATVQLIPAGPNAWVVVYSVKIANLEQLKAHVVSGNGKGHCLEVHMSRLNPTEQQRQSWFVGFRGVTVVAE